MEADPILVLVDGDCALCSRVVRWFSVRDRRGAMLFAANAGEAARIMGEPPGGDDRTVVVWEGSSRLVRVAALVAMLRRLDRGWRLLAGALSLVPAAWADLAYDFVAARRRRLGRSDACAFLKPWQSAD